MFTRGGANALHRLVSMRQAQPVYMYSAQRRRLLTPSCQNQLAWMVTVCSCCVATWREESASGYVEVISLPPFSTLSFSDGIVAVQCMHQ